MKTKPEPPDEIEALLPWFATGRLSGEDRAEVAAALETREDLLPQMRRVDAERAATIRLNEHLGAPGEAVWRRIAAVLAAEPRSPTR